MPDKLLKISRGYLPSFFRYQENTRGGKIYPQAQRADEDKTKYYQNRPTVVASTRRELYNFDTVRTLKYLFRVIQERSILR